MRQAPTQRVVESACSRVGRATQTAGTFLSVLCLIFVTVFTVSIRASFQERIGYFFLIGLPPALGFYLVGHLLRGMLVVSSKLCGIIAPHWFRWQAPFTQRLLNWASASVRHLLATCSSTLEYYRFAASQCMQILSGLAQKGGCALNRQYRYARRAIIEFSCLLIRNAARFVITMQQSVDRSAKRGSYLSFEDMNLIMSHNMLWKRQTQDGR